MARLVDLLIALATCGGALGSNVVRRSFKHHTHIEAEAAAPHDSEFRGHRDGSFDLQKQEGNMTHTSKREIPSHTSKPVEDEGLLKKTQQVVEQVRGLHVRHGLDFEPFGIGDVIKLNKMTTGAGMEWADVELFSKLGKIQSPSSIYGIGNAFGFSTLVLASIFKNASIDIIDAGIEGKDNVAGIDLTNQIALEESLNVKVYKGFSPQDVPASMRNGIYQLAFIDGHHTPKNLRDDFAAILPHMATKCIIVFHDLTLCRGLAEVVKEELMPDNPDFKFAQHNGTNFNNVLGTGLFYRGFTGADMTHLENLGSPFPGVFHLPWHTKR